MKPEEKNAGMSFWSIAMMGLGAVVGAGVVTYVGIAVN